MPEPFREICVGSRLRATRMTNAVPSLNDPVSFLVPESEVGVVDELAADNEIAFGPHRALARS